MRKINLSVGLLALLATGALGQAKLTGIETNKVGNGLKIVIQGEGLTNPRTLRVMNNSSYIVEFDCSLATKPAKTTVSEFGVKYIQVGWYKSRPPVCRVHLKLEPETTPTLTQIGGNWVILVGTTGLETLTSAPIGTGEKTTSISTESEQDRLAMEKALKDLTGAELTVTSSVPNEPTKSQPIKPIAKTEPKAVAKSEPKLINPFDTASGTLASLATDIEPKVVKTWPKIEDKPRKTTPQKYDQTVSLDFVGTDVVQILKALSIQAGVNIVSSPDVSPSDKPMKLSISLNNVDLESALSYVTAMAGLRYARIGNTFVVTPTASFSTAMRQIMERNAESYQTRVINLMSGEAEKIREATLKAMPPDGRNGYYEIIVPGQNEVNGSGAPANPAPQNGGATGGATTGGEAGATPPQPQDNNPMQQAKHGRAFYLMIVGEPSRLNAVEDYAQNLDAKIAASFSVGRSQSTGTVAVPIQSGQTDKIKAMIEKLLQDNPRSGDYSITETSVKELSQGEQSTTFLLMIGPAAELDTLKSFAITLDKELCKPLGIEYVNDMAQMVKDYEVVELNYVEPVIAAQDLKGRFKDLWVTVVPDSATPGLKGEGESKKDEAPTDSNKTAASPEKSELKKSLGQEPMRLMMRGTRATIEDAKRYLAMIDVAPKQIAIELRVLEMTKEDAFKLGIDWSILAGGRASLFRMNQGLGISAGDSGAINGSINYGQKNNGVTGKPFNENVSFLGALDQLTNDRNLVARPNALVSHGRETKIFVGDTIRYVKQIQATQSGITVITDELQVGSTFNIKAKIGDGGNIALDLTQNFSILTAFTPVPGGGNLPQTSDRTSSMFVNMASGETIAIGGLILDNDRKTYGGIPVLKDLPIIGKLFGRTNNLRTRTEIVFFLTAVEVNAKNRANAASPAKSLKDTPDPIGDYKKVKKGETNKVN